VSELEFGSRAEWEAWLEEHQDEPDGAWLRIAKKGTGVATVTHADALEAAICFGWIDAQRRGLDETYFLQRFVPRRPRSRWSKINRAKAEELIAAGLMRPAGLREVERARADGRWEAAYEGAASASVPPDLRRALDADPAAAAEFDRLDAQNRYAILYRVQEAKRPETRARRIEKFVAMLRAGERIHRR
jgi:uncharacterized protein YdeI (YjbR/CyaY-like superfamily)